jgi:hypothetical protein
VFRYFGEDMLNGYGVQLFSFTVHDDVPHCDKSKVIER